MEIINLINKCLRSVDVPYKVRIPSCKKCHEGILDEKDKCGYDLLVYIEDINIPKREEELAPRKTRIQSSLFCF